MSLFPAFINARMRKNDSAPRAEAATDSRQSDSTQAESSQAESSQTDARANDPDDNIFELLPPKSADAAVPESPPEPAPQGRNVHPVNMTDLSRLSIDRDGRLYWDGKPVEVHRRIAMSRAQIIGASIVAAFVVVGAIGAALQGAVAARDLSCRLGWSASACALPAVQPRPSADIPA
jgi:hypothetical protein